MRILDRDPPRNSTARTEPGRDAHLSRSDGESGFHIELEAAVGVDVLPDQRGDCSEVGWSHPCLPFGHAQDALHHEGVDVDGVWGATECAMES